MIVEFAFFGLFLSAAVLTTSSSYWQKWIHHFKTMKKYTSAAPQYKAHNDVDLCFCSICMDKIKHDEYVRQFPCAHIFHSKCVDTWIICENKNECPNCRKQVY